MRWIRMRVDGIRNQGSKVFINQPTKENTTLPNPKDTVTIGQSSGETRQMKHIAGGISLQKVAKMLKNGFVSVNYADNVEWISNIETNFAYPPKIVGDETVLVCGRNRKFYIRSFHRKNIV